MDGFTFPGMIDDPGCTGGSFNSPRPAYGPDPRSLKSMAMRNKFAPRDVSALEKSANGM